MEVSPQPLTPYRTLDAWRGLASLWVVWYHASDILRALNPALALLPIYQMGLQGNLGVQIFFVVSGYCIAQAATRSIERNESVAAFLLARGRRIYPPMWCSLLFYVGFSVVASRLVAAGGLKNSHLASKDIFHASPYFWISNLTLTQIPTHQNFISIVCWTLGYEIAFYGIVALSIGVFRSGFKLLDWQNALHLLTTLCLVMLIIAPRNTIYPFDLWPHFGFGVLIFDWLHTSKRKQTFLWCALISILTLVFISLADVPSGWMHLSSRLTFTVAFLTAFLLAYLFYKDVRLSKWKVVHILSGVGRISYSLYLIHFLFLGIANQVVKRSQFLLHWHCLALLFMIAFATLAGYGFHLAFEKPFMKRRTPVPVK